MPEAFRSSLEHVLAELRRIDQKLRSEMLNVRRLNGQPDTDGFRGLYISEAEVDGILAGVGGNIGSGNGPDSELARADTEIDARKAETLRHWGILRLVDLTKTFSLAQFDTDVILLCLLPHLDVRYQRLFGYLQDDVTRKEPSVDLALRLFCNSFSERLAARQQFSPVAPLARRHLVVIDPEAAGTPLPSKALRCDERVAGYLLGSDQIDSRLLPFAHLMCPSVKLADVVLPSDTKRRLIRMVSGEGDSGVLCFHGPTGTGKRTTAKALCARLKRSLLVIDVPRLLADETPFDLCLSLVLREALLLGTAVYWESCDPLLAEDKKPHLDAFGRRLAEWRGLSFVASAAHWERPESWQAISSLCQVAFPFPSFKERERLWKTSLNGHLQTAGDLDLAELSNNFRLTGGQIRDAVADARDRARWTGSDKLSMDDLRAACQEQSNRKLGALAHKVESRYAWSDIVLPREQMTQLEDIVRYVKHRQMVYGEWNFARKLSLGKGLAVLFAGRSGTGKTMSAGIIANELKLDIYKIDLASVVSKYIGETEKNLSRIFTEAEASNAILFFDEADALFGKRSEVKDSHDRYANIEIGYLLQRMEEYEGMVILSTNMRQNMDDAFVRRMQFIVEFPYPEEEHRYRIWKGIFPTQAPVDTGVDYEFLARQFKVAGGNIKNIALSAAFLAADDGQTITMTHLARAAKREFNKMGKLCVESDFGEYYALVAGD